MLNQPIKDLSVKDQFIGKASSLLSFMNDSSVTDILINGLCSLYIEKSGSLMRCENPFTEYSSLFSFVERLIVPLCKRLDAKEPYIDGRLSDGSRFHIIYPPIAPEGPIISIRKKREALLCSLESFGNDFFLNWCHSQVNYRKNIIICGATGSGKTTLLCRLIELMSKNERIVVIEESSEIFVDHPQLIHLESRTPSPDGFGEVTLLTLLRNALRMRPDRILLGECRGSEVLSLLQVLNSGHEGSICTIHANSALNALRRLESLSMIALPSININVVREWISGAIHGVIYLKKDGEKRKVAEIIEIKGLESGVYRIVPVFNLEKPMIKTNR